MRNERRYTEGQKLLLKFDREKLNDDERELLRRVLLPRTKYLPQTAEEGEALALQMLRREKYERMLSLIGKIVPVRLEEYKGFYYLGERAEKD